MKNIHGNFGLVIYFHVPNYYFLDKILIDRIFKIFRVCYNIIKYIKVVCFMEKYRDHEIIVIQNNENQYPYKAIAKIGNTEIKHKGQSESEAISLVKQSINKLKSKNLL